MLRHAYLLIILIMAIGGPVVSAGDVQWTGWLGPERNGWVKDFTPPDPWPQQLTRGWEATVGTGYGSPIVSGNRVYQHARQGEDEVVWCLELDTGRVVWRKQYTTPFRVGDGARYHGKGPKSCPVFSDGRLFTLSITGLLTAWDAASGKVLWRQNAATRFKEPHPYWGTATSPLVDGNNVIVRLGNDDRGTLFAFNVADGKEAWRYGNEGTCYSSPRVVDIDGTRQVIEWNHRSLVGVESHHGQLLWEYPFPHVGNNQNMPTLAFHDGHILVGGENRGLRSLRLHKQGGLWKITPRWSQRKVSLDMASPIVNNDLLFGFSHYGRGRLFCLDTKTGKILWLGPERSGGNATFLAVPGHVLVLLDSGELKVIEATGERLNELASYRVAQGHTWAPPVLLPDGILIKGRESLTFWKLAGN